MFKTSFSVPTLAPPPTDYNDCGIEDFYSSLPTSTTKWTKSSLGKLLLTKHRNRVPYTSSKMADVWDALIDLDPGYDENSDRNTTVHLIYKNKDVDALSYGNANTWNREHMWPKSRGIYKSGEDYTDIHALRPSDWNVNSARGNKFYGECNTIDSMETCKSPAHQEADSTTATDRIIWTPPSNVRGDIARAMFYMESRYYGEGNDPDLKLVDCPSNITNDDDPSKREELAYLSTLLLWHGEDPVDERERIRNTKACRYWQGNRNPFIDYPELTKQFYSKPRPRPKNGAGYNCDDNSSPSSSATRRIWLTGMVEVFIIFVTISSL